MQLHKEGKDRDVTEMREQALELIEHPDRKGRNARQTMLMHKGGHGMGQTPEFPNKKEIEEGREGHETDFFVNTYGDGSYTTPTKSWCALGGIGGWVLAWNCGEEKKTCREEQHIAAPVNGQTGSSTRMEVAAWIAMMTKPMRFTYATDSASMLGKAVAILKAAKEVEDKEERGESVNKLKLKPF